MKEENKNYLKKELLKVAIVSLGLIVFLLILFSIDLKTKFALKLSEKIMNILIK